ncbi:MAG: hypothetical protein ACLFNZ_02565 [Spirochaetaceae bacterium]
MNNIKPFIHCRTCGRYLEKENAYNGQFCSSECSRRFAKCKNCGAYFFPADSEYEEFCSKECYDGFYTPLREVNLPHFEGDEL